MSAGRVLSRLLVVALAVIALTLTFARSIDPIQNPSGSGEVPEATTTSAPGCGPKSIAAATIVDSEASGLSIAISRLGFDCAETVVVASGDSATLIVGAQLAAAARGPLLAASGDTEVISEEIVRLNPSVVYIVGDSLPSLPGRTEARSLSIEEALAETSALLGGAPVLQAAGALSLARAVVGTVNGTAVLTGAFEADVTADAAWVASYAPTTDTVWLADGSRPDLVAPVLAAAGTRDETVLLVDPLDLRTPHATVASLRAIDPDQTVVAGNFDSGLLEWQLPALLSAPELPGGGLVFYPGRRLVALYGNPTTGALGVLGEQSAEESVQRVTEIAAGYDADEVPVLPSFEIIATVASAFAGADNDYSEEMSLETLRPWIEVAGDNGIYVILDLQPGRTDFLTQAQRYEEFLRLPHVGLALDSEWRLEPNQVHLRQIGSVDAAEINTVVDWLAALVREQNLPQKYLLLHQFRLDMITNRDQVRTPPELAVVIQMDGQGPLPTKYDTWNALTAGTDDAGFTWGWKNFYDEDTPRGGATAEEVLDLDPVPGYVSFQ
jgi:hypothetical protein